MKNVLIFVFPGHQGLDVTGPADVLVLTNKLCLERGMKTAPYEISLCAPEKGLVRANASVLRLYVDHGIDDITDDQLDALDTFMIADGAAAVQQRHDPKNLDFVRRASVLSDRVATVCTGAYLLANTGLLDGHSVATHWRMSRQLDDDHPNLSVVSDAITHRSGRYWSSGGVSAEIDLALAIVEADLGADIARAAARMVVMYLNRPGGQMQFSTPADIKPAIEPEPRENRITEIISYIKANPMADLRRASLAEKFNLTEKTLARRVEGFTGMALSHLVEEEEARLRWAQLHLESSDDTLEEIAQLTDLKSADTMRRVFLRKMSITPTEYRNRFKSALSRETAPMMESDMGHCPKTPDFCPSLFAIK